MPPELATAPPPLIQVANLHVYFTHHNGGLLRRTATTLRAVDGVSFTLKQGETLAFVGPPGSGKTTLARTLALLEPPTSGRVLLDGEELGMGRGRYRQRIQMVFSNPYTAFAPRMRVEEILREASRLANRSSRQETDAWIAGLMRQVGLNLYVTIRFPRELSGGMRQRLGIARALATRPDLLICDQPGAFLNPAVGDAIIDLLHQLQQQLGFATLLTSRNLEDARHADRVAIMLQGRIVEMAYYSELVRNPLHPFTQVALQLRAPASKMQAAPEGNFSRPSEGCPYAKQCPLVEPRCHVDHPIFVAGAPNHGVACHLVEPFQEGAVEIN
jgi:oligopeptide/dipeptide ABC transporter ATP-binding protein